MVKFLLPNINDLGFFFNPLAYSKSTPEKASRFLLYETLVPPLRLRLDDGFSFAFHMLCEGLLERATIPAFKRIDESDPLSFSSFTSMCNLPNDFAYKYRRDSSLQDDPFLFRNRWIAFQKACKNLLEENRIMSKNAFVYPDRNENIIVYPISPREWDCSVTFTNMEKEGSWFYEHHNSNRNYNMSDIPPTICEIYHLGIDPMLIYTDYPFSKAFIGNIIDPNYVIFNKTVDPNLFKNTCGIGLFEYARDEGVDYRNQNHIRARKKAGELALSGHYNSRLLLDLMWIYQQLLGEMNSSFVRIPIICSSQDPYTFSHIRTTVNNTYEIDSTGNITQIGTETEETEIKLQDITMSRSFSVISANWNAIPRKYGRARFSIEFPDEINLEVHADIGDMEELPNENLQACAFDFAEHIKIEGPVIEYDIGEQPIGTAQFTTSSSLTLPKSAITGNVFSTSGITTEEDLGVITSDDIIEHGLVTIGERGWNMGMEDVPNSDRMINYPDITKESYVDNAKLYMFYRMNDRAKYYKLEKSEDSDPHAYHWVAQRDNFITLEKKRILSCDSKNDLKETQYESKETPIHLLDLNLSRITSNEMSNDNLTFEQPQCNANQILGFPGGQYLVDAVEDPNNQSGMLGDITAWVKKQVMLVYDKNGKFYKAYLKGREDDIEDSVYVYAQGEGVMRFDYYAWSPYATVPVFTTDSKTIKVGETSNLIKKGFIKYDWKWKALPVFLP